MLLSILDRDISLSALTFPAEQEIQRKQDDDRNGQGNF
jgi:hypothetical protein